MSIQYDCDNCHHACNIDSLIYIEYTKQNMCPVCINELIWDLLAQDSDLNKLREN